MYYRLVIVIAITVFSCQKDLDINDFSDDFGFYQPEIRIEALMLPADNTAIIRIDRSSRLDEGLNDEGFYNCIDDDEDWNYYYCSTQDTSYENKSQCIEHCNTELCILHYYFCETDDKTFVDKSDCENHCTEGKCVTDDVGSDGKAFDEQNIWGELIGADEDGSEGDGKPNCGEPNVDEFDEVLPGIHVNNCQVYITQETDTCFFEYQENGGSFFEDVKFGDELFDIDLVMYGAWVPNSNRCNIQFNKYDSEYTFFGDCSRESGFESYGIITATDIPKRPVIYYHEYMEDSLLTCTSYDDNDSIFNCMEPFNVTDTMFVEIGSLDYERIDCSILQFAAIYLEVEIDPQCEGMDSESILGLFLQFTARYQHSSIEELFIPKIRYASLYETDSYQAVQYIFNEAENQWIYYHGHAAAVTSSDKTFDDKIATWFEVITAEKFRNRDYEVESSTFKYDIYTFSSGYENYYFYDALNLDDPVRSNLRDQSGIPVMGAFGSMTSRTIQYEVISIDSLLFY